MKYFETHFEDYIAAVKCSNFHPEFEETVYPMFPDNVKDLGNVILHGGVGVGKYSQALYIIHRYSPSRLKYDKKMKLQSERYIYHYRISDIHYEVDFALLGCNSKTVWHELFMQIVDVVTVKAEKVGIILCKNFHTVQNELLDVFYSYLQEYSHPYSNLQIRFMFICENVSFLPNNLVQACRVVGISPPKCLVDGKALTVTTSDDIEVYLKSNIRKGLRGRGDLQNSKTLSIICNNIIRCLAAGHERINFGEFRENLYDILVYNLDINNCLWYMLKAYREKFSDERYGELIAEIFVFLQQYNNNYRPIYHLENIFLKFI